MSRHVPRIVTRHGADARAAGRCARGQLGVHAFVSDRPLGRTARRRSTQLTAGRATLFNMNQGLRSLFLGGVLPVIAFAVVEAWYGTVGGIIAGIVFGVGEITYEYVTFRKVQGITIAGNVLVIVLGGVSLLESDPVFFKLQPAILIFSFAAMLIGSSIVKRPFMVALMKKQRPDVPEAALHMMSGMNWRLGLCLVGIGLVSVHAAYYWTTARWAMLKGIGVPVILVIYMLIEVLIARVRLNRRKQRTQPPTAPPYQE